MKTMRIKTFLKQIYLVLWVISKQIISSEINPPTTQQRGEVNEIPEITPKKIASIAHMAKIRRIKTPPIIKPKITTRHPNLRALIRLVSPFLEVSRGVNCEFPFSPYSDS